MLAAAREVAMRVASVAVLVFICSTIASGVQPASPKRTASESSFVGTWRLVSFTGARQQGAHPTGVIYYDGTGHMAAQIAPDRARPSWPANAPPSPEQARDAITGYVAYFGTYEVDERARTVTHHREGALNMFAVDLVRKYEFSGNGRLTLTPLEPENAGLQLVWERIR
jgi:hypothetical protein